LNELLAEVLEAHGGLERWRAAVAIDARIRSGGLLLATRLPGSRLSSYRLRVEVGEPLAVCHSFPREGQRGVFDHGRVRIETEGGDVVDSRDDPRAAFFGLAGLRRNLRWDALDATYFAGYAMWNYLTTPLLLTRDGVRVVEGARWRQADQEWRTLEVDFPPDLDTHSAHQTFYVDSSGLIRRHDYTAEVVGGWARAAHRAGEHRQVDGLTFPTRRWVRPIGPRNRALRGPTLVWLQIDALRVQNG
jgi:hypothetical protein